MIPPFARAVAGESDPVLAYDLGGRGARQLSILALKLDHLGDFLIGLPALRRLREAFPDARIRLVVGGWNLKAAEVCGLADEVASYDFFSATGWTGAPHQPLSAFDAAVAGRFDLALDLRVDDDTRLLLTRVDAGLRSGVGLRAHFPYLDIALPPARREPREGAIAETDRFLAPDRFTSRMADKRRFHHEAGFDGAAGHVVYGPHIRLPVGPIRATFSLELHGGPLAWAGARVTVDVARDGEEIGVSRRLRGPALARLGDDGVALEFDNPDPVALYEFRVFIAGRAPRARLRFGGVRLERPGERPSSRLRPAALHIGEQLSLLVQLTADRTRTLYREAPAEARRPGPPRIVVAPFSNRDMRDWPQAHYVRLIRSLLAGTGAVVTLIGSPDQAPALERIRQESGGGERLVSLGGRTAWTELPALLREADLVICNNSGVAHLAAAEGARVLALYSGSHQPQEWGPRGARAHALMTLTPCSPCGYDRLVECPFGHRCMVELTPEIVLEEAKRLLAEAASA